VKSKSPLWVWLAFVMVLLTTSYVAIPPTAVQHAALWAAG
jgi:hypothetical protein